ncbi:MAG TPA: hypothetical protein VK681_39025 [Reyranella sp.]|nr:hypothetical protein [Reyranella sp.]
MKYRGETLHFYDVLMAGGQRLRIAARSEQRAKQEAERRARKFGWTGTRAEAVEAVPA